MRLSFADVMEKIYALVHLRGLHNLGDREYIQSYAQNTDRRVRMNPRAAIGGFWETLGQLQFDFLKEQGLMPTHNLLDIGCGTLRAGRLIIPYLNPGMYTGFDMSGEAIREAHSLIEGDGLNDKAPRLIHTPDGALDFSYIEEQFDFLLAQSVFTHLRPAMIEQCFQHVRKVMRPGARFYFTYNPKRKIVAPLSFAYERRFFHELAEHNGMTLSDHPEYDQRHPDGQIMLCAMGRA